MPVKEHIHRLRRTTYGNGTKVYFCTNNCSYKVEVPFALGKIVECSICFEPFTMNEYSIKLVKPHCNGCGKTLTKVDGKAKFISKGRQQKAISDLAQNSADSMRDRLSKVVTMEKEEDI